ncbi:hypothetical protein [Marinobacter persicus]|uniref:Uncharacterized protein n=1 Tax=Marinobacter persicus TaxID=930118 RepID=A0A2S6G7E2_9GAMM|nr:hypothetical protein [Marinobacter persicus]PPK52039.1 hypothetical protein BY455_108139 [Marinobacter persicus]PPK55075.1 hypothetical protein B0H24_1008139 [Marinobacter persicus]PPK56909.1 hypothetical protein BY454_12939 [Marinobacter persicus]
MKKQICASLFALVVACASQGVVAEERGLPAEGMKSDVAFAGSGPGVGAMGLETRTRDDALQEGQAVASVQFRHGAVFFGGEARYQATAEDRLGARGWDADNLRVLLKVGVNL